MKNTNLLKIIIFICVCFSPFIHMNAQVLISSAAGTPDASAMLDVQSDSKGLLIPRISTAQRTTLATTAAEGLMVFDTETHSFYIFADSEWVDLSSSAHIWKQNGSNIFLNDGTMKVGIGTQSPEFKLDIRGDNIDEGGLFTLSNSDQSHRLLFFSGRQNDPLPFIHWKEGDDLRFSTDQDGWSEKMRITSGGYLGIGTSSPAAKLHILNSGLSIGSQYIGTVACFQQNGTAGDWGRVSIISGNTGSSILDFGDSESQSSGSLLYDNLNNFMSFSTNETEKMRITSDGDVGIGTSSPNETAVLDVASTEKGFLPPRMNNEQRDDISSPATGLMIFNTDENLMQMFNGTVWKNLTISDCAPAQPGGISGNTEVFPGTTNEVYTISVVPYASSYTWTVPTEAVITLGQGTGSITVDFGTGSGYISVTANNGCGSSPEQTLFVEFLGPFNCGASTVTDIDGNLYSTALIGEQCWIGEDLKVSKYPNGDPIPFIDNDATWGVLTDDNVSDAYCFYGDSNNDGIVDIADTDYGAIYTYAAAIGDNWERDNNTGQGVCPDGWHLPTFDEWTELIDYLGGTSIAGGKLKEAGTTHWYSPNTGATNESEFSALPGGYRYNIDGTFSKLGESGIWWYATEFNATEAWYLFLNYAYIETNHYANSKSNGHSVRCLRD